MPKYIGDKLLKARYVGEQAISKIYRGASLVWGAIKEMLVSVSGKQMTLVNCTREEPLNDFRIYGRSEQIKYQGYQLINFAELIPNASTTVYSLDGENITVTATGAYSNVWKQMNEIAGKQITIRCKGYTGGISPQFRIRYTSELGNIVYVATTATQLSRTYTIPATATDIRVQFYSNNTADKVSSEATILQPMIEYGAVAHDFETFVGGIPSPSPSYPQDIVNVVNPVVEYRGKNLWNPITEGYLSNIDGSISASNACESSDFIDRQSQVMCISSDWSSDKSNVWAYRVGFYDADKKWIKNIIMTQKVYYVTKNETPTAKYIRVSSPKSISNLQIEHSATATDYEPYHAPQTYQWNHTLYGIQRTSGVSAPATYIDESGTEYIADYVDVENNCIVRNVKKLDVSQSIIVREASQNRFSFSTKDDNYNYSRTNTIMSNVYTPSTTGTDFSIFGYYGGGRIYDSRTTDLDTFKALIADVDIYYICKPYTEPLTDAEISAFLALKTYKPTTIVSNDQNAYMETSYHTKLEELDVALSAQYNYDLKGVIS